MEKNNPFEIDRKLSSDFIHAVSMRNIAVEDLVNNLVGQELRAGRTLTDEQFDQLDNAMRALKRDKEELAGLIDRMNLWSVEIAKAMNTAMQLEKSHMAEADGPAMQFGGLGQ